MAECIISRRGGSGTKGYAYIVVSYPVGATCTCSDGTKTLTAKGTGGMYTFNVPYSATWTVTATQGGKTSSKYVVISSEYHVEQVVLTFDYYIIKGEEHVDFELAAGLSLTTGTDSVGAYVQFAGSGNGNRAGYTSDKLPVSEYSTLKLSLVYPHTPTGSPLTYYVAIRDTSTNTNVATYKTYPTTKTDYVFDISSLTEDNRYVFYIYTQYTHPVKFYEVVMMQ